MVCEMQGMWKEATSEYVTISSYGGMSKSRQTGKPSSEPRFETSNFPIRSNVVNYLS